MTQTATPLDLTLTAALVGALVPGDVTVALRGELALGGAAYRCNFDSGVLELNEAITLSQQATALLEGLHVMAGGA